MKATKTILIFSMLLLPMVAATAKENGQKSVTRKQITAIVNQYKHCEDFEVVNIGHLGTSLLRGVLSGVRASEKDDDFGKVLKTVRGVDAITIVDFEDCNNPVKSAVRSKLEALLAGKELLMEAKDEDDSMQIYCECSKDAKELHNLIMYSSGDCALICLFGRIPVEALAALAK